MAVKFVDVKYKNILDNINLEIKSNQIVSIVGKNGSGKTSFLNLIFGLDLNFEGKIVVGRKNVSNKLKFKDLQTIREKIFYLKQDYQTQLFNVNILEDIKYRVKNLDLNKLDELLKDFSLSDAMLKKNYSELSDGEIKKVLIIMMLMGDFKIVLLDDPTSGLDQKSVSSLIKILKKQKRDGKTIIITSYKSEFLLSLTDKVLVLENSCLFEYEDKYQFFENQELLNQCGLTMPNVLKFRKNVLKRKGIKLIYRDNVNDLIKDVYRNVK